MNFTISKVTSSEIGTKLLIFYYINQSIREDEHPVAEPNEEVVNWRVI
jgi:hypothetical protein